jgi:uncharacterized protein YxjI
VPISVRSACGKEFQLKDELAGKLVKCPACGEELRVPGGAAAPPPAGRPGADPVFRRNKFLLRQKLMTISEKYSVSDEDGKEILFVERPAHFLKSCLAALAAVAALFGVAGGCIALAVALGEGHPLVAPLVVIGLLGGLASTVVVGVALAPKRHVHFYRDANKKELLLQVDQDQKFAWFVATFTVKDGEGKVLARLRKNYLHNILRKRWDCFDPEGKTLSVIREDSLILSILRRFLGPFFGLLRAQFVFFKGDSEDLIGEFNRKFTLLDRYVLDLGADREEHLDRRIGLAIGVMLDTGERR